MSFYNGFDVMNSDAMNSEINNQAEDDTSSDNVGNHVRSEAYEGTDNTRKQTGEYERIMRILDQNEQLVRKYGTQLVEHFSKTFFALPEDTQRDLVGEFGIYQDRHDIVYQGIIGKYEAKMNGSSATAIG